MKNIIKKINSKKLCISVIGLGYVGLPLAVEFGKNFTVKKGSNSDSPDLAWLLFWIVDISDLLETEDKVSSYSLLEHENNTDSNIIDVIKNLILMK